MSAYSGSTHSSRSYQYSSSGGGGPGQTSRVTETHTVIGPDGVRSTDTRAYYGNGPPNLDDFGDMNLNNSAGGRGGTGQQRYIVKTSYRPSETPRYTKGWGPTSTKSVGPPMQLEGKTYDEIRQQCLREGRLFEDPDFLAVDSSIFYSRAPPRPFVWKRPTELCANPEMFVGGASRFDIQQGELGDCWLLAAVACLCQNKTLLARVVPHDQDFGDGYAGIFHFQFWRFGKWADVIIDDRLPTYYDRLVFMHSADKNEYWTPLLEKAYAKLHGSYEALKGGATSEAMEDFTGGVTEMYDFRQNVPSNLFTVMEKAYERNALMGVSIEASPGKIEAELSNGLIMGHAYSITCVKKMDIQTPRMKGKIPMVRVRNPWGNEAEWKGAWSDKSTEWKFIPEDERQSIGLTFDDDGEFWMSFNDFTANFQKLEICQLSPECMDHANDSCGKKWESACHDGSWKRRVTAGGCRNYLETFWTNPQYRVQVVDSDENDDDDKGTIIVALMQKNRRKLRREGQDMLTLGYVIYQVPVKLKDPKVGPLDMRFFKYNASVAKSPAFINLREVCGRHKLLPGHYCIVPSTFEPNQEGDFLLRVFSEKPNHAVEIDEETGMADVQVVDIRDDGDRKRRYVTPLFPDFPRFGFRDFPDFPDFSGFGDFNNFGEFSENVVNLFTGNRDRKLEALAAAQDMGMAPVEEQMLTATTAKRLGEHTAVKTTEDPTLPAVFHSTPMAELTDSEVQQNKEMREAFKKISGEDMEIDAYELQDILNAAFMKEFQFDGFSPDTCRSMVAMMDVDHSGKLGFEEFKKLWNDLRLWKSVFKQHDKDKSGTFNSFELRQAFHACGFRLSNSTFNALVMRYSHRDGKIYFDDYIHCVARMKTMFDIYKEQDKVEGKSAFSLDEFIQTTMYS